MYVRGGIGVVSTRPASSSVPAHVSQAFRGVSPDACDTWAGTLLEAGPGTHHTYTSLFTSTSAISFDGVH